MSFNRLDYDKCAYAKFLEESTEPLEYLMYQGAHVNESNCGDHPNMLAIASRVGVESELRNLDRHATKCPSKKFCPNEDVAHLKNSPPKLCERTPSGLKKDYNKVITIQPERVCGMKK